MREIASNELINVWIWSLRETKINDKVRRHPRWNWRGCVDIFKIIQKQLGLSSLCALACQISTPVQSDPSRNAL